MSDAQIFQLFSFVYLAVGVGMFLNRDFYSRLISDFCEHAAALYIGGIAALAIGFVILAHRGLSCTHDWSMILSLIGWLALIKGILILVFPKSMINLIRAMKKENLFRLWSIVIIVLGLALAFLGFCPISPI